MAGAEAHTHNCNCLWQRTCNFVYLSRGQLSWPTCRLPVQVYRRLSKQFFNEFAQPSVNQAALATIKMLLQKMCSTHKKKKTSPNTAISSEFSFETRPARQDAHLLTSHMLLAQYTCCSPSPLPF